MSSPVTNLTPRIPEILNTPQDQALPKPFPKGITAIIIQYYAPMTCDVVKDHTLYQKQGRDLAAIRFNYVALMRDFEELADLGRTFDVSTEVDRVISAFALTRFTLQTTRRDGRGGTTTQTCANNLLNDLQREILLKARNTAFQVDLSSHDQRTPEEFDTYPKVHAVLCRLGLMSKLVVPMKKEESESSLTDKQVSFSSSGRRIISKPRVRAPLLSGSYT